MKKWGYTLALLLLCTVILGAAACGTGVNQDTSSRLAKVTTGNLLVTVSGSGNIEIASESKLAFGVGGKIQKIYVKEGDKVRKGDVLARLETDDLELSLTQAENARKQAEMAVSQAQLAVSQAEMAQTQAEVAKTQAEVALETAKYDLDRMADVKKIKDNIEEAEHMQQIAEASMKVAIAAQAQDVDIRNWAQQVENSKQTILYYQKQLNDLLTKSEYATLRVTEVNIKALQVQAAEQTVKQTTQAVAQTKLNIEQAKRNIDAAQHALSYTGKTVDYAKKQLDKATLTAPFDGVIASVTIDEGDIVSPPTVATRSVIHLIDNSNLELKVDVDEIDIPSVKTGQKALISVDAIPDLQLEGKVTFISPLSSPQSGVVLYRTTIGFQPLSDSQLKAGMSATANIILHERNNVLIVPERAIYQNEKGESVVKTETDGQTQEKIVVTGITDGFDTEIVSGVNVGEIVVVETRIKSTSGSMSLFGQ